MVSSRAGIDMGDPCTPMAWQQRDINYHQNGYQDRYGPGAGGHGSSRVGPPSTSDRVSHRTDKSWRTHRDSRDSGNSHHQHPYPDQYPSHYPPSNYPPSHSQYPPSHSQYPPSRPSYSTGRPASRPHSPSTTSSSSTSSSADESEQVQGPPMPPAFYGYPGYYPGYPQGPGTIKSAQSVPALAVGTWDGEPCPVHHGGPPGPPGPPGPLMGPHGPMPYPVPPPGYPPMMPPPNRRVNSIYDMRLAGSPPAAIYGTLPGRPVPADRRSLAGSTLAGIPPHLLPPMARPLPIVVDEKGNAEPLPVRQTGDKGGTLPPAVVAKVAASVAGDEGAEKKRVCCRGGACVGWIILALICLGVLLAVMLRFIL